ncbi:MAG: hypothetical protein FWB96_12385 [Defluviitaleaceae bacterium]|nr:hypothetical protein [Defluviitaleaceae bacterium]
MDKYNEKKTGIFRAEVVELIKDFTHDQAVNFARICAIRALPFLSCARGFGYWNEVDRQKYLMAIFHAIDTSSITAYNYAADAYAAAAHAAADAAHAAAYAAAYAATYAARTYTAAAYAAHAAHAAYAAVRSAYTAKMINKNSKEIMGNIIREDIENIKANNLHNLNNDTSIYSEIWHNFLDDLKDVECAYWANLYENLFANRFVFNEVELKHRLSLPDEIEAQGAAAVGRYMENLGGEVKKLNEARIIILGDKGAGKTSLARKLLDINAKLTEEKESTEGVITSVWKIKDQNGKDMNAHIWDFAGHSITHSSHRCFMTSRCLYIYVYNGRIERSNDPAYWLEQIRIHGENSPVLFLINEQDNHRVDITKKTLKKEYPAIVGYYHANIGSEDTRGIQNFRQTVMEFVQNNVAWNNQVISLEAYKIKAALRKLFEEDKPPHITCDAFNEIAFDNNVTLKQAEKILEDLHTLGICLWYGKDEMGEVAPLVLNPDWITTGIYRIINKGYNEQPSSIDVDYGVRKLEGEAYEYPSDKVKYLFRLMKKYELAYFKDNNTNRIYIPGLLPEDMPDDLPDFLPDDCLTMSFEVRKALPPNIVCRVIVQRNEEISDDKFLWRKGVVLKYGKYGTDATALIQEDDRRILVDVMGKHRTEYLVELRNTLERIFDDYKGIKPDLKYKILLPDDVKEELRRRTGEVPLIMELAKDIDKLAKTNTPYVVDEILRKIFMNQTITAYEMSTFTGSTTVNIYNGERTSTFTKVTAVIGIAVGIIAIGVTLWLALRDSSTYPYPTPSDEIYYIHDYTT